MPLRSEGMGKGKAFVGGMLSGIVEPIGAILTILAAGLIVPALPYLLSFAAGAMLYVVVEELIPENVHRRTLQCRNDLFCGWIFPDDGAGCGTGIMKFFEIFRSCEKILDLELTPGCILISGGVL